VPEVTAAVEEGKRAVVSSSYAWESMLIAARFWRVL